jgi:two-component system OmpR family response regulator
MHILLIEDDAATASYAAKGLTEAGHVVDVVEDGKEGMVQSIQTPYDVMIVDRMLPSMDGLSIVKALRASGNKTPVLFLTAVSGVDDRVEGLDAGADDYLTKPFAFSELLARINALYRRPSASVEITHLRVADLELDLLARVARRSDQEIELQPREFTLLEVLMRNEGRVVSRTMLLEQVWDFHFDPKTSVVETHVSRLRSKIDKPFDTSLLHTVRNLGYSLHAPRVA